MIEVFLNYGIAFLPVGKYEAIVARIPLLQALPVLIRILLAAWIAFAAFTVKLHIKVWFDRVCFFCIGYQ
jgi:hypothetical protein